MNLNFIIIEEVYNNLCRHLEPHKYQEISLDPNSLFKRIITNRFNSIYLHKYSAIIEIATPRIHAFVAIDDDIITLDGIIVMKYELTNPSTNICEITQAIIDLINVYNLEVT
jgi:hypothetical protein